MSMQIFSDFLYRTMTEVVDQQVQLFNQATRGGIVLQAAANVGNYADRIKWGLISGLVRVRDVNGTGAVTAKTMDQISETSVKLARGTPPVTLPTALLDWIKVSPDQAGAMVGQQLAVAMLQNKVNTAIKALVASLSGQASNLHDYTATGVNTLGQLVVGAAKLGDRSESIACWVMHSKTKADILGAAVANANVLFNFGTINVVNDGMGRPLIVTDSPDLTYVATGNKYRTLGLVPGAAVVEDNGDFRAVTATTTGTENIVDTYQAQWSFNLSLMGFQWDKTNGAANPSDAAVATATNWDKIATSNKDLAGVLILSQ